MFCVRIKNNAESMKTKSESCNDTEPKPGHWSNWIMNVISFKCKQSHCDVVIWTLWEKSRQFPVEKVEVEETVFH